MIYKRQEFEGTARRPPRDEQRKRERERERDTISSVAPLGRLLLGLARVIMIGLANAACRTDRFPLGQVAASDRVTAISRGHANGGGGGGTEESQRRKWKLVANSAVIARRSLSHAAYMDRE